MRRVRHCNRLSARPGTTLRAHATVPAFIETSMVPARAGLSADAATKRMASDMREAAYRDGGLTKEGLELLGYSPEQISALAPKARRLANELAVMT